MSFHFDLVSPERQLFSGDVLSVIAPGSEGDFMILEDHAPLMATLRPGVLTVETGAATQKLFVSGGFAEVNAAGLTVLAEQAIPLEDLRAEQLEADISGARAEVSEAPDDELRRLASEKFAQLEDLKSELAL